MTDKITPNLPQETPRPVLECMAKIHAARQDSQGNIRQENADIMEAVTECYEAGRRDARLDAIKWEKALPILQRLIEIYDNPDSGCPHEQMGVWDALQKLLDEAGVKPKPSQSDCPDSCKECEGKNGQI